MEERQQRCALSLTMPGAPVRRPRTTLRSMSRRWWTSDLHLGHAGILAHTQRPYGTVESMNIDLIERWNERVGPADEVYVLGDLAMGPIVEMLELMELCHGAKFLVPGNHDKCWEGYRSKQKHRVDQWRSEYEAAGLIVLDGELEMRVGGEHVAISHFPYEGDSQERERFVDFRPRDRGAWLLHGHVHEKWRQRGRMINVGVDAWGGYPVADDDLVALFAAGPREIPRLPWRR